MSTHDEVFLRHAFRLAMNGRGAVEPNPMVGCVLVRDGVVIGEGWHARFGGPHAEPAALEDCLARGHSPAGATAYVSLEPCCHTGKKTPPCAPRLIEAKIARVVIGCLDPNPAVNGQGVAMLRAGGIRVDGPLLEAEAKQLIAPFIAVTTLRRPYVTLKWAQTADGRIAGPGGKRMQISNAASSRLVHRLRARSDAILVGIRTVLADDPMLTARDVPNARRLTRCVLDPALELPPTSRLVRSAEEHPLLVYTAPSPGTPGEGVEVVSIPAVGRRLDLAAVLRDLGSRGATHLLVESGGALAANVLSANLVDRLWVIRSPSRLDDAAAPPATDVPAHFVTTAEVNVEGDVLTESLNARSEAFFAAMRSPDV